MEPRPPSEIRYLLEDLYPGHPLGLLLGMMVCVFFSQVLTGGGYFLSLPKPALFLLSGLVVLTLFLMLAHNLTSRFLQPHGYGLPGIYLWVYPFLNLIFSQVLLLTLLKGVTSVAGRDCWSRWLELNAKCTTLMFTSTFFGYTAFLGVLVFLAIIRYFLRSTQIAAALETQLLKEVTRDAQKLLNAEATTPTEPSVREQMETLCAHRQTTRTFNRRAILILFLAVFSLSTWLVFFRPETILYHRGQAQLITRQHPEVAYETFKHLIERYPDYTYLDTVYFQMAWTLDRRMNRWKEAIEAYQDFLRRFGEGNVWADDAMGNLIRLSLDKEKNATETLLWTEKYKKTFPDGMLSPHVSLYEIRALLALGREPEARLREKEALASFGLRSIPLYNNEDDFVETLAYPLALQSLPWGPSPK